MDAVTLFGIVFVLGGIVSIVAAMQNITQVEKAQYRQRVTGIVRSVKEESGKIKHSKKSPLGADKRYWITEEEIPVNGQMFVHQGRYVEEPGESISHTVISNDGVNWKVNDSDMEDVIFSSIVGIICAAVGIAIVWFKFRK